MKNLKNLGKTLNKSEQKAIHGGVSNPVFGPPCDGGGGDGDGGGNNNTCSQRGGVFFCTTQTDNCRCLNFSTGSYNGTCRQGVCS